LTVPGRTLRQKAAEAADEFDHDVSHSSFGWQDVRSHEFASACPAADAEISLGPTRVTRVINAPSVPMLAAAQLDILLTLQLATAWAGERGGDEPRLCWWSTDMVSEYGGLDFFTRVTPRTAPWAALEIAREAARRIDETTRGHDANPDRLHSLFHFGFATDEQLGDRLAHHKRSGLSPQDALPDLPDLTRWDADAFAAWAKRGGTSRTANEPSGRRLTGKFEDPVELAKALAAALVPFTSAYPCPHVRHA
jgi:hypothetical protein